MSSIEEERWKPIPGYENYEISSVGRYKNTRTNNILKTLLIADRPHISVKGSDSKRVTFGIHQAMAMAFLGHERCGHDLIVDHIDNNKSNNVLSNLQVITHRENSSKDSKNKTGYIGVFKNPRGTFYTQAKIDGKIRSLGTFDTAEEASEFRKLKLENI